MHLAERFSKPVITLIDTPGAYPGIGAEERGQAEAIARNLMDMSRLKVPMVSAVIGEGGSGGALAIGISDRVMMFEYSTYSVISPEGCAAILWKDRNRADLAASALKLNAEELLKLKVIDKIIKEPAGGAHRDPQKATENLKTAILESLEELLEIPQERLLEERYKKYRRIGIFSEP
jgi:acetyl-CoA carboxylase carboxyl transferase subunit alpha